MVLEVSGGTHGTLETCVQWQDHEYDIINSGRTLQSILFHARKSPPAHPEFLTGVCYVAS